MTQPAARRFVTEANVNDIVTEQVTDALADADLEIGTVTTGAPGSAAAALLTKTDPFQQVLDLTIPRGDVGQTGPQGRSITSIARTGGTGAAGSTDTYTITYSNATTSTFTVVNGTNGRAVTGIARTSGTGAPSTTDTYTITYSDATTSTFTVVNGSTGAQGIQGTPGTGTVNLPPLATNLVTNPSFEVDLTGWTDQNTGVTRTRDTSDKYVGAASMKVVVPTTAFAGTYFAAATIQAGTYTFSAWIKGDATSAGKTVRITMSSGTVANYTLTTSWQRITVTHTYSASIAPFLYIDSGGTTTGMTFWVDAAQFEATPYATDYFDGTFAGCYWSGSANASTSIRGLYDADDVVRVEKVPELARNLILNPGFEGASTNWLATDNNCTSARSTTTSRTGSACLAVTATAAGAVVIGTNTTAGIGSMPVSPNRAYYLGGWTKAAATGRAVYPQVIWYDAAGASIASASGPTVTSNTATWSQLTGRFTSPANAAAARVAVSIAGCAAGEVHYLDDMILTASTSAVSSFDGDAPGAKWAGAPYASESFKMLPQRADTLLGAPELARNLVHNPSLEIDASGWSGTSVTLTRSTAVQAYHGTYSLLATVSTAGDVYVTNTSLWNASAGKTYTLSFYIQGSNGRAARSRITWYDAAGSVISIVALAAGQVTTNGTWQRSVAVTSAAPSNATAGRFQVEILATALSEAFYIDGAQVTEGPAAVGFFNGDTPGCRWAGLPHASESIKLLPQRSDTLLDAPELARNLLSNPSFIGGVSGWAASGSLAASTTPTGENAGTAAFSATNDAFRTGQGYTPGVVAGRTYAARVAMRKTLGTDTPVALRIEWWSGPGSGYLGNTIGTTVVCTGTETVLSVTGVAPATAAFANISVVSGAANSFSMQLSKAALSEGTSALFFDGDTPGCRWVEVRGASASVKVLPGPVSESLDMWLDAGRAQGMGSPEGVVAAPVGTEYKDTLATNGVVKWIKQSGTGNTGWYSMPTVAAPAANGGYTDNAAVGPTYLNGAPASSSTGAVQVAIPVAATTDVMLEAEVELWSFDADGVTKSTLRATCYSQANGGMTRTTARITSSGQYRGLANPITYPTVRWVRATNGTTLYLVVGNVGDVNAYMQAKIARVSSDYTSGGTIGQPTVSLVTTLPTGNTAVVPLVDTLGVYRGTGSPEAAVAAPVGSEYVDLAATNGAVKWIKATGNGNTGWITADYSTEMPHPSTLIPSLKADGKMAGGGRKLWNGSGVSWNQRFLVINKGTSATRFAAGGFFALDIPPDGTVIPGVGGAASQTVAAGFVPMPAYHSLYYILPLGSGTASVPANYRMVNYTSAFDLPAHWLLVAARNADDNSIQWGTGEFTAAGPAVSVSDRKRGTITSQGSPEGALIASVGTEYVDENATNGAIKWIKASGSGNTGWKVVYGDTGWRDVTALADGTRWNSTSGATNYVSIRRINDTVSLRFAITRTLASGTRDSGSDGIIVTSIPVGFAPTSVNGAGYVGLTASPWSQLGFLQFTSADIRCLGTAGTWVAGDKASGFVTTPIGNGVAPWPTALPGVAG